MIDFPKPKVNLKGLGKSMPRRRQQSGFVKPTGKKPRTWTGYWYEYKTLPDGTEKRFERSRVLGTQAELTKGAAKEKLREHIRGLRPEPESTFEIAARSYLELKQGDWSNKNRKVMQSLFRNHIIPKLGSFPIKAVKPTDIKKWINEVGATGASYSLVHKCLTHVRAIFDQLVEDDIIAKNPARSKKNNIRLPKTKKPSEHFLQFEECQRLLGAAEDPRDYVLLSILMTCALRPSEAFALRLQDVRPGALRIDEAVVDGDVGNTKTEESNNIVPIPPVLEEDILAYAAALAITDPKAYLFPSETGTPYDSKNYLNRKLKPLAKRAQIPGVNFQVLRRTCATQFQNYGGVKDVQALLRHANANTTLKHYQKKLDTRLAAGVEGWHAALTGRQKVVPIRKAAVGE